MEAEIITSPLLVSLRGGVVPEGTQGFAPMAGDVIVIALHQYLKQLREIRRLAPHVSVLLSARNSPQTLVT